MCVSAFVWFRRCALPNRTLQVLVFTMNRVLMLLLKTSKHRSHRSEDIFHVELPYAASEMFSYFFTVVIRIIYIIA